jgi:hypothetical protein
VLTGLNDAVAVQAAIGKRIGNFIQHLSFSPQAWRCALRGWELALLLLAVTPHGCCVHAVHEDGSQGASLSTFSRYLYLADTLQ